MTWARLGRRVALIARREHDTVLEALEPVGEMLAIFREHIGRIGFYVLFALVVTISVQLVGVYLVFTTLIVPAVATYRYSASRQLAFGYALAIGSYLVGLAVSVVTDLPSSAVIVWVMAVLGLLVHLSGGSREQSSRSEH